MIRAHDFECSTHGTFEKWLSGSAETISQARNEGQSCPICEEISRHVWRRAPAVRNDDRHGVRMGGNVFMEERLEELFAMPDPNPDAEIDAHVESEEFRSAAMDVIERKLNQASYGDLPPLTVPTDANSQKVLSDNAAGMAGALKG